MSEPTARPAGPLAAIRHRIREERGDVPGWVLITIMTAGLVAVLWPFAEQYLRQILESALDLVRP